MIDKPLPFAVALRMHFIDTLLDHYGTFNRALLCDYFGISTPQASNDIGLYQELAPANIEYDTSAKTYRRTRTFERVWK